MKDYGNGVLCRSQQAALKEVTMFEDLNEMKKSDGGRKAASFAMALVIESAIIFAIVITPLIFFSILPDSELLTFLMTPPAPPTPIPPTPPQDPDTNRQRIQETTFDSEFVAPRRIPDVLPPPDDLSVYATVPYSPDRQYVSPVPVFPVNPIIQPKPVKIVELPPPPPPQKETYRLGGDVLSARLIRQVPPTYPQMAKAVRAQGDVVLEVEVDDEGNVVDVVALSGHNLLRKAAEDAVRQWKYSPTLLNGEPVPVIAKVTVKFTLN
jgi:protein TonB